MSDWWLHKRKDHWVIGNAEQEKDCTEFRICRHISNCELRVRLGNDDRIINIPPGTWVMPYAKAMG